MGGGLSSVSKGRLCANEVSEPAVQAYPVSGQGPKACVRPSSWPEPKSARPFLIFFRIGKRP